MKKIIIITSIAVTLLAASIWIGVSAYNTQQKIVENKNTELGKYKQQLDMMSGKYFSVADSLDSANKLNKLLSRYRTLTDAMYYRDDIRKPLLYERGDIVMLKRDSSRVLVTDVLVGGGKFEYYIKYQVEYKDSHREMIDPELIFDKK
jgi:hypothetical protein